MANQGALFGLHKSCRLKTIQKFNLDNAKDALRWIEAVIGRKFAGERGNVEFLKTERDVSEVLKDGTALCELMNKISPGSVRKYHKQPSAFQQMENIELFLRACINYGMEVIDTFQVKDLYEARAMYTVINCIYALGSLAQHNGFTGPKFGVKLASRNERRFGKEQELASRSAVSRQNSCPPDMTPQTRMTPYGLPRQIIPAGDTPHDLSSSSHAVIGLQYGSNQVASQSGMTAYGTKRQILSSTGSSESNATESQIKGTPVIGLQYGSNKVATQSGMTAYGMPRQIISSGPSASFLKSDESINGRDDDVF